MLCSIISRNRGKSCGFFFFQAEDGIRDADVTGVQTCALPILIVDGTLRHLEGTVRSTERRARSELMRPTTRSRGGTATRSVPQSLQVNPWLEAGEEPASRRLATASRRRQAAREVCRSRT